MIDDILRLDIESKLNEQNLSLLPSKIDKIKMLFFGDEMMMIAFSPK